VPQESFLYQNSNQTITNNTTIQNAFKGSLSTFNATQGRYFLELLWAAINMDNLVSTGITWTWTVSTGTANIVYSAVVNTCNGLNALDADESRVYATTATSTISASATNSTRRIRMTGLLTVTSSTASIQPQFTFTGTAPGTATRIDGSSYLRFTKVTNNTSLTYLGNWS
jgi:hypothetical protein